MIASTLDCERNSLGRTLRLGLWLALQIGAWIIGVGAGILHGPWRLTVGILVVAAVAWMLVTGVRVAAAWERALVLRLGQVHDIRGPGIMYLLPGLDTVRFFDTRPQSLELPALSLITRDRIIVALSGTVRVTVTDPTKALLGNTDSVRTLLDCTEATLHEIAGAMTHDELRADRNRFSRQVVDGVEAHAPAWGLHVETLWLREGTGTGGEKPQTRASSLTEQHA